MQTGVVLCFLFAACASILNQFCEAAKATSTLCTQKQEEDFQDHKRKFRNIYKDQTEESERKSIWCGADNFIKAHNAKQTSHTLKHNWLSDKTPEELARLNGHIDPRPIEDLLDDILKFCVTRPPPVVTWPVPKSVNWTAEGVVVKPRNQGHCGSCYAFASVAAVEAMIQLETGKDVDLSRENLIDCSIEVPNSYCNGGNAVPSFAYIANHGLYSTADYPYTEKEMAESDNAISPGCRKLNKPLAISPRAPADGFAHQYILNSFSKTTCLPWAEFGLDNAGDEELLKQFVARQPVYGSINADDSEFHHYESGVLSIEDCSLETNHAILIVGYGYDSDSEKDYWIIKNSWGGWQNCTIEEEIFDLCSNGWGQGGYALIERGKNMCGIAQSAIIPNF